MTTIWVPYGGGSSRIANGRWSRGMSAGSILSHVTGVDARGRAYVTAAANTSSTQSSIGNRGAEVRVSLVMRQGATPQAGWSLRH